MTGKSQEIEEIFWKEMQLVLRSSENYILYSVVRDIRNSSNIERLARIFAGRIERLIGHEPSLKRRFLESVEIPEAVQAILSDPNFDGMRSKRRAKVATELAPVKKFIVKEERDDPYEEEDCLQLTDEDNSDEENGRLQEEDCFQLTDQENSDEDNGSLQEEDCLQLTDEDHSDEDNGSLQVTDEDNSDEDNDSLQEEDCLRLTDEDNSDEDNDSLQEEDCLRLTDEVNSDEDNGSLQEEDCLWLTDEVNSDEDNGSLQEEDCLRLPDEVNSGEDNGSLQEEGSDTIESDFMEILSLDSDKSEEYSSRSCVLVSEAKVETDDSESDFQDSQKVIPSESSDTGVDDYFSDSSEY